MFEDRPTRHVYESLTPDVVLDALSDLGLAVDGRMTALSSYENRVYQVMLDDNTALVAKFYRPERWTDAQILEEHSFAAELMADEVPLVGPLTLQGQTLHHAHGFAFSVSPRRGGRMPELDDGEVLEWIGRFIARMHNVGARQAFATRPTLDVSTFALESRDWLIAQHIIPLDQQTEWLTACNQAIEVATQKFIAHPAHHLRLHGDCHPGNILWTPTDLPNGGPHFVDLDDARMGPAIQDLWMLLSGERAQRTQQLAMLLDGYEQMRELNRSELALIEPLRTLRLIHYSAWLARRKDDPAFAQHFAWFGSSDYWAGQIHVLVDQCEAMQEEPLYV
ncbi:serine/threonine protein kinase [Limnohabitans sp.]|uniref:serine/threonine protein kinase n=1 Tax=Limnohabitans sp. TaxID=1907725 RepID=UPI00286F5C0D|nr:serine/threonine protein kinase [Limnohabitans sp.]